jgi:hypothetical protein
MPHFHIRLMLRYIKSFLEEWCIALIVCQPYNVAALTNGEAVCSLLYQLLAIFCPTRAPDGRILMAYCPTRTLFDFY